MNHWTWRFKWWITAVVCALAFTVGIVSVGAADNSPWHEISTPNKVEFSIWTKCVVLRGTPYRIFIEHGDRDQFIKDDGCLEKPR